MTLSEVPLPFNQKVVLFSQTVKAGFPSPAESYAEESLNLHSLAVVNPAATYFVRVSGDSMQEAGVLSGDIAVVDRSLLPSPGDLVVAEVGGEFTLKRLEFERGRAVLVPANPRYPIIRPTENEGLVVVGVVRGLYRELK